MEVEPNNGPAPTQMQDLGTHAVATSRTVLGALATGGVAGGSYSGDYDLFRLTFGTPGNVTFQVSWTGTADVDVYIHDAAGTRLRYSADATSPISITQGVQAATYVLALYSKDLPASWTVVWSFTPGTPRGPSCVTSLIAGPGGGCSIALYGPPNGAVLNLPYEFGWQSNGGCSTPYHLVITGNPPSPQNSLTWDISTDPPNQPAASQIVPALTGLTSDNGQYHWQVYNFSWAAWSPGQTFSLSGVGTPCVD